MTNLTSKTTAQFRTIAGQYFENIRESILGEPLDRGPEDFLRSVIQRNAELAAAEKPIVESKAALERVAAAGKQVLGYLRGGDKLRTPESRKACLAALGGVKNFYASHPWVYPAITRAGRAASARPRSPRKGFLSFEHVAMGNSSRSQSAGHHAV